MRQDDVVVQQPATAAQQLFLLYHGVGDNPQSMAQLGRWFAREFPQAQVVAVAAPVPGSHWYSEIPQHDRSEQQQVNAVLPEFMASVHYWQQQSATSAGATALVGFSQGSTMVLEAIKAQPELAGRVVAFSGRYVTLPEKATTRTTIHLIHGEDDERIAVKHAWQAAAQLTALGGDVTLDIVDDLPHAIDERSMTLALKHLHFTIPKRYFDEALSGAKPGDDDVVMMM